MADSLPDPSGLLAAVKPAAQPRADMPGRGGGGDAFCSFVFSADKPLGPQIVPVTRPALPQA